MYADTIQKDTFLLSFSIVFFIDDDLPTPVNQHSRQSIAEKDDHLPPLRPVPPSTRRMPKRTLISTHSDAADSAVSMVILWLLWIFLFGSGNVPMFVVKAFISVVSRTSHVAVQKFTSML